MAYRFLLEVPETMIEDAKVVVASAGDAQVLVQRPAHGLGFEEPYVDLTVAAHTLRVIDVLYDWAGTVGATRADTRFQIGIVPHNGQRVGLHEIDPASLVGTIRRDQPWVENFTPRIGEHEFDIPRESRSSASASGGTLAVVDPATTSNVLAVDLIDAEEDLTIGGHTYAVIQVANLAKAEQVYREVFRLEIRQRMRQEADGTWHELGTDADPEVASHNEAEADIALLVNGALHIALARAGRAARLDYGQVLNEIAIVVPQAEGARIKAMVLMRGYTLLTSAGPSFGFRDPFGVVWNVEPHSA